MRFLEKINSARYFFGVFSFAVALTGISMADLHAQEGKSSTSAQVSPEFANPDIWHYMKANNKRDCLNQAKLFTVALHKYKEGVPVNEAVEIKMFEPLFADIYETLRKKGVDQASIDNINDLQKCVDTAKPHKNAEREHDMAIKYSGCKKLNSLIIETLGAVKKGKDINRLMDKYQARKLDLSGTQYDTLEQPALFFIGQIYRISQNGGYSDAVQAGSGMSMACMM